MTCMQCLQFAAALPLLSRTGEPWPIPRRMYRVCPQMQALMHAMDCTGCKPFPTWLTVPLPLLPLPYSAPSGMVLQAHRVSPMGTAFSQLGGGLVMTGIYFIHGREDEEISAQTVQTMVISSQTVQTMVIGAGHSQCSLPASHDLVHTGPQRAIWGRTVAGVLRQVLGAAAWWVAFMLLMMRFVKVPHAPPAYHTTPSHPAPPEPGCPLATPLICACLAPRVLIGWCGRSPSDV